MSQETLDKQYDESVKQDVIRGLENAQSSLYDVLSLVEQEMEDSEDSALADDLDALHDDVIHLLGKLRK